MKMIIFIMVASLLSLFVISFVLFLVGCNCVQIALLGYLITMIFYLCGLTGFGDKNPWKWFFEYCLKLYEQ